MLWFVSACAYIALDVVITEAKLRKIAERSAEAWPQIGRSTWQVL